MSKIFKSLCKEFWNYCNYQQNYLKRGRGRERGWETSVLLKESAVYSRRCLMWSLLGKAISDKNKIVKKWELKLSTARPQGPPGPLHPPRMISFQLLCIYARIWHSWPFLDFSLWKDLVIKIQRRHPRFSDNPKYPSLKIQPKPQGPPLIFNCCASMCTKLQGLF